MDWRIEINIARKGAEPVWHFLMEDDNSPCIFDTEEDATTLAAGLFEESRVVKIA